eukprot:TRINITY_DN73973_c0_g1_i1.p1 TRINITY_DN73973_c0_g1~~TRINITY_DN73973_c0_g1_i1.p1  ORF type:complete len:299 (-),score=44.78 TRINITY_DN73973_c0_g1_i1:13-909(-)
MSLEGQVAVITGGAGGIGWASAWQWLQHGGKVVLADIQDDKGENLAASHPGSVLYVQCDTRKREDLENAAAAASKLGQITCWFNNAGFARPDDINLLRKSGYSHDLRNMVDVNLGAYIEGFGIAMRAFRKDTGGVIISTASMAGLLPLGAPPVYSATKAAVVQFTRAVGLTLGEKSNVRVYCLCPSYTATAQGPPTELISKSLGGVLRAEHMGEGFIMLAMQKPPNGSIMRVTARAGGKRVVHDLMTYGRELGGKEPPREGFVMKDAPLEAINEEKASELDKASDSGREHEGMRASKL